MAVWKGEGDEENGLHRVLLGLLMALGTSLPAVIRVGKPICVHKAMRKDFELTDEWR